MNNDRPGFTQEVISRRHFLAISAAGTAAVAAGCAVDPVTGRRQIMFVSEAQERDLDRTWSPHQFSADYGAVRDVSLNNYVAGIGGKLVAVCHRPHMPYNFRALNSIDVNAYTFPAGSIAVNRGLLAELGNEAELAAVLGHEIGHVCARHAGENMTKSILLELAVAGVAATVSVKNEKYAWLAAGLGGIGAMMLLCRYSRDDEREADELGMEYMVKGGYDPHGMSEVMEIFLNLQKEKPSALDILFSTHPLSKERYETALARIRAAYAGLTGAEVGRDRYMDHTASIRRIKPAIEAMQKGEELMGDEKFGQAEDQFRAGLRTAPDDYAGLLLLAKCHLAQKKYAAAQAEAERARSVYPEEPHAVHVCGMAKLEQSRYDAALADFSLYGEKLPGNPNTLYYKGFCLEKMGRKEAAAQEYEAYLADAPDGEFAEYVRARLEEWGYIKKAGA